MNPTFKVPRGITNSQSPPSTSPHSSFHELWMTPAPNPGLEGARSWLEENIIPCSNPGQKRKHAGDEVRSDHKNRAAPAAIDPWDASQWCGPMDSTPSPPSGYKRPQPRQRARLLASQSGESDEDRGDKVTPARKRRTELPHSSPITPHPNLARTFSSGSEILLSDRPATPSTSNATGASQQRSLNQRAQHTPTPDPRMTKYNPRAPSAFVNGSKGNSRSSQNRSSQASNPQRPTFKQARNSSTADAMKQASTSNTTREHVNSKVSRMTDRNKIYVPSIDRRIQHCPPDPAELNRILAQVPDILKDLDEKQAQVIRDLAEKVNHQEKEIKELKSSNVELNNHFTSCNHAIAELKNKFERAEKRVDNEMRVMKMENQSLKQEVEKHVDQTCESVVGDVQRELKRLEEKMKLEDDYEPNEELIDIQGLEKAEEENVSLFVPQE